MDKTLLYKNENFALWRIMEELVVDEAGYYETSYPYDEMISVEELFGHKVRVTYYYKQPVLRHKMNKCCMAEYCIYSDDGWHCNADKVSDKLVENCLYLNSIGETAKLSCCIKDNEWYDKQINNLLEWLSMNIAYAKYGIEEETYKIVYNKILEMFNDEVNSDGYWNNVPKPIK